MVYSTTTFSCDKCHKRYSDPEEAARCETNHIVNDAVERFGEELRETLKPYRAANLAPDHAH